MATFKEVAAQVLKDSSKPLSAREITELALENNLLETEGKTPEATMAAHLYTDINKNKKTVFLKVGKGRFTLKDKKGPIDSPDLLIEKQNEIVRKELKEKLHEMDPYMFEYLVGDLLIEIGYENVQVTKRSGDGGVDVLANLTVSGVTNVKTVIQVKRFKSNIDVKVIRELRGSAEVDQRGLIITTAKFGKGAVEESMAPNKMPVSLVDGDKLLDLMFKYSVGIKKEEKVIYTINNEYFESELGRSLESTSTEKSRSLWPLPGGINKYVETLNAFLEKVNNSKSSKNDLVKWFLDNYDNVNSKKTAGGYTNVPRSMGLIEVKNGVYSLTQDGKTYLSKNNNKVLYEIIHRNIFAIEEVMQFLTSSEEPQKEQDVLDYLTENHGVTWTTFAQVSFRLMWLINLSKIEKVDDGFVAKK